MVKIIHISIKTLNLQFDAQDVLVPWHFQSKEKHKKGNVFC